jgi:hypothetical protein
MTNITTSSCPSPLVLFSYLLPPSPSSTPTWPTQHRAEASLLTQCPLPNSSTYITIPHIHKTTHHHFAAVSLWNRRTEPARSETDIFHGMSARKMKKQRVVSSGAKHECDTLTTAKLHQNNDCGNATRRHPANDTAFEVVCRARWRSGDRQQTNWHAR